MSVCVCVFFFLCACVCVVLTMGFFNIEKCFWEKNLRAITKKILQTIKKVSVPMTERMIT